MKGDTEWNCFLCSGPIKLEMKLNSNMNTFTAKTPSELNEQQQHSIYFFFPLYFSPFSSSLISIMELTGFIYFFIR